MSVGDDLRSILERSNRIASTARLDDLLCQMLDLMVEISGGTSGTCYLHDTATNELVFSVIRGSAEDQKLTGQRIPDDTGIVGAALHSGKPIVIEDLKSDPRWYREIHPDLTARLVNAITIPLLLEGRPIGAIQIFNYHSVDIELLQLLSSRMASEIDKAVLLEKSLRTNRRLQLLVDALGEIGSILDRDQLLTRLTANASRLVEAEGSATFLVCNEPPNGTVWLSHASPNFPYVSPAGHGSDWDPSRFQSTSTISVPLQSRQITIGAGRVSPQVRTVGNLVAVNKISGSFDAEDNRLFEALASQASTVLQIAGLFKDANELLLDFIKTLARVIDAKDPYTCGHSERVSDYSVQIARCLDCSAESVFYVRLGSLLHDIGKLGVPDHILAKAGKLSDSEYEEIKKHPGKGMKIVEQVHHLHNTLPAIIEHHEKLDGSGYPHGLHGDQISLMGRIVAVADVFDALTTDRPYRKAMQLNEVFDFLNENKGVRFDSACIDALNTVIRNS